MLRVPFTEKEQAKRLGARWDMSQKIWYVPEGVDPAPLKQWLPVALESNIRAPYYFLARSTRECWRCERQTLVHAIMLPREHEVLYVGDDPADDHWQESGEATTLSYIYDLQEPVPTRLRVLAPRYKVAYSQTIHRFYWMNHCEHCAAKLGDFETNEEFGVAFNPVTPLEAAAIHLHTIREPCAACCGSHTCDEPLFDLMQRRE